MTILAQGCQIRKFISIRKPILHYRPYVASHGESASVSISIFVRHIDSWLAKARQEKINTLEKLNEHIFTI